MLPGKLLNISLICFNSVKPSYSTHITQCWMIPGTDFNCYMKITSNKTELLFSQETFHLILILFIFLKDKSPHSKHYRSLCVSYVENSLQRRKQRSIKGRKYKYGNFQVKHNTKHLVRSFRRVLPPHFQREDDALVSFNGDAGHCQDACHYGCGLHKRNCLANENPCRQKQRGNTDKVQKSSRG